jgi:hypothetical protein
MVGEGGRMLLFLFFCIGRAKLADALLYRRDELEPAPEARLRPVAGWSSEPTGSSPSVPSSRVRRT